MGGGEVDVALHVLGVGGVASVGLCLRIVSFAQLHRRQVIGVSPCALIGNHIPPNAYILGRLDPRGVLDFAGFVQVERDAAGQNIGSLVAYDDRTPRRHAGSLQVTLVATGVGGQPALEDAGLVIIVEVHRGIVDTSGFVQVDVETVVGAHHQGCLHAAFPYRGLRGVLRHGGLHLAADFAQARGDGFVLLGVIIARKPPGGMVTGHGKLRALFLDDKIREVLLRGKLVAEAEAVVKQAEAQLDETVVGGLGQRHAKLVVMIANAAFLAPYGCPCLVESSGLGLGNLKSAGQIGFLVNLAGIGPRLELEVGRSIGIFFLQVQTQMAGANDVLAMIGQRIRGTPLGIQAEIHFQAAIRRLQLLCTGRHGQQNGGNSQQKLFHILRLDCL